MTARTAIAWTVHRVRLRVGWGLMTVLACVALSACTGGSSPSVSVFPPTASSGSSASSSASASSSTSASASGSATGSASGGVSPKVTGGTSAGSSSSASASPSPSGSASGTSSPSPTESPALAQTTPPAGAPNTGGGGTAGFQDVGLAVLGGAAIMAGFGGIAYRRWKTRNR